MNVEVELAIAKAQTEHNFTRGDAVLIVMRALDMQRRAEVKISSPPKRRNRHAPIYLQFRGAHAMTQ
jgi:hypothetical protein